MGEVQDQDQYEERLKQLFNSFDSSGCGSLNPEELSDLCQSLQLEDATPALLHSLLQEQDRVTARVDFDQFKDALILILSSSIEPHEAEQETKPVTPEIQPKFVKGSKRYGRRSTPEFMEPVSDFSEVMSMNLMDGEIMEDDCDSTVPRKRERWNVHEMSSEDVEYEAEGQMQLWNPDEPSTPRRSTAPLSKRLEERLRDVCEDLSVSWDGCAGHTELLAVCEHLGLEISGDLLQSLTADGVTNVQEFVSRVVSHNTPPTPSASTPYRQLKRHHSTQPFDEGGRRIAAPCVLTSTIGMRLFSTLDDGSGYTPVELILDAWMDEGIENSTEILQALNFSLSGKLSLSELTAALENELLVTKNVIHRAALASFKAEIRYLLERVDRELREKEKIRSDLEKADRLKAQLASEVDEHHSAIEHTNNLNLRKLEQEHREKLAAVRSELMQEMDQIQQQAGLQREELEAEIQKIREDESFLRDHLSISVKENRRLEMELLDCTESLVEAQNQITKLQGSFDNLMKEKFGDLDPGSSDFLLQEDRIKQLRSSYEAQCRELQDRIDELQSELQQFHSLGRTHQSCHKPLSEELESKSPGMESDPGIGSEEVQPFSMSLDAEMMLEQLKEQHLQEMEVLRNQLENKISEFDVMVEKQRVTHEDQKASLTLQNQQEVQALREELAGVQTHVQELQNQLGQAELERTCVEQKRTEEKEALEKLQEEEVSELRQQLFQAQTFTSDLEEQLETVRVQQGETEEQLASELEELRNQHAAEIKTLEEKNMELCEARVEEERQKLQEEKDELEKRLLEGFEREQELMKKSHEDELNNRLEEVNQQFEEEKEETERRLNKLWQEEKTQLEEQNNNALQVVLEEEMLRQMKEQEEKEKELRNQWEMEAAELQRRHEEVLLHKVLQERSQVQEQYERREKKLKEDWDRERLQLEEDYEGMLQDRLNEDKEKLEAEVEDRVARSVAEEKARLEESHREAVQELTLKHTEERTTLSITLDKLRDDITQERRELEVDFSQRIKEVEDRFAGDQDCVAVRFQADVLKLEQHYQTELKEFSDHHREEKLRWEEQLQEAQEKAEEQRRTMEESLEQEKQNLNQEWTRERLELENVHTGELEALVMKNQQLQSELDDFTRLAQNKEIELSRDLNDLHNRLKESLQTSEQLQAQSDQKTADTKLLLNQTVEDFKQEREELLRNQAELQEKYNEMLSASEKQIRERIDLLTERDDLKMKIEELELLLQQAAVDFDLERKEQLEMISSLEEGLKHLETDREDLTAERNLLRIRIQEQEIELSQVLAAAAEAEKKKEVLTLSGQGEKRCSTPSGICPHKALFDDFSQEACLSPVEEILGETDDEEVEMITETPDTEDDCSGNINSGATRVEEEEDEVDDMTENLDEAVEDKMMETNKPEDTDDDGEGCNDEAASEDFGVCHEDESESESPNPARNDCSDAENRKEAVSSHEVVEFISSLEAFEGESAAAGENKVESGSCEAENKPQDISGSDTESSVSEEEVNHETVVNTSGDRHEAEGICLHKQEAELFTPELKVVRPRDDQDLLDEAGDYEEQSLFRLQVLHNKATQENILLHEKISLLQQKTEILENLLAHNSEKLRSGHEALEENYSLKVKMLLLMEHVRSLEMKTLNMTELQIRYEDCMCENRKLKDQNRDLEKRVWCFESRMNIFHDFRDQQVALADEIGRMREDHSKLSELFRDLESRDGAVSPQTPSEGSGLEDPCTQSEIQNRRLRRALTDLQDRTQTLSEETQAHRSESSRLSEENLVLAQRITALKEEDLKQAKDELTQTSEHLKKEKLTAQKAADSFHKQIFELQSQSQQLQEALTDRNTEHTADLEKLKQQLAELMEENEKMETFPAEEKKQMAACVSALETELTKALKDTAQLKQRNSELSQQLSDLTQKVVDLDSENPLSHLLDRNTVDTRGLRQQLAKAQQKVKSVDETLQSVNHQSSRLKSEVRVLQQERDSLRRDVALLRKQLQNANDKNQLLEISLQSSGLQSHSKRRLRDEMCRLKDQEQLLRQENERLQAEVHHVKGDLVQSREKVRQLDATIVSLKQHKQQTQSSLVKSLEQENLSLKQQLQAQKEQAKDGEAEDGHFKLQLHSLQQENELLKAQTARLLLEQAQAQLVGLLPSSPHRPRQHRGEDPDHVQDERERKMKNMEARMIEIELSLHNVKLLLKEKVSQLKDQRHKNGKADVMIKELHMENSQLLKALEITEQRQKIAEKKNYLLEEKINSMNKIVRELNLSPLSPLSYPFTCS